MRKYFNVTGQSNPLAVFLTPVLNTCPFNLATSCATLYTLGNYHILKHGAAHMLGIYLGGAIAGAAYCAITQNS
jgi:hypothetical protein